VIEEGVFIRLLLAVRRVSQTIPSIIISMKKGRKKEK
jgi:hypothetical protein